MSHTNKLTLWQWENGIPVIGTL